MKNFLLVAVAIFASVSAMAQAGGELATNFYPVQRNTIFAEASVVGAQYSLNYDFIVISRQSLKISTGAGAGITSFSDAHPLISFGLNALIGKSAHRFETGVGINTVINETTVEAQPNLTTESGTQAWQFTSDQHYTNMYACARVGYRYQKDAGGLFLRAGFTPMLPVYTHGDTGIKLGGTVGIGYTFGAKNKTAPVETGQ